jgi:CheY-like chemotaxis protein
VRVDEVAATDAPPAVQTDTPVQNFVRLAVADNGHGMDAKTRERIFEPFFTTKPAGHGTGLGLAVVHGIITSHGGTITVTSSPGRGTTFEIYFPAHARTPEASPSTGLSIPRGDGQAIMVVDDDVAMGRSTQRFLLHQGYRVDLFHTPGAALGAFVDNPTGYDLVVTDFSMPLMSGLDLAEKLRTVRADVPIILATGSVGFEDQHRARLEGLCRFLPKPVPPQALAMAVAEALLPEHAPGKPTA